MKCWVILAGILLLASHIFCVISIAKNALPNIQCETLPSTDGRHEIYARYNKLSFLLLHHIFINLWTSKFKAVRIFYLMSKSCVCLIKIVFLYPNPILHPSPCSNPILCPSPCLFLQFL